MAADPNSFILSLMQLLSGSGPQGYTPAIRQNLGLNVPQGGPFKTSGMTATRGPQGYVPRDVRPDPKVAPLPSTPVNPTTTPVTPTTTPTDPTKNPQMPGYTLVNGGWWPDALLARRPNMLPGGVNAR